MLRVMKRQRGADLLLVGLVLALAGCPSNSADEGDEAASASDSGSDSAMTSETGESGTDTNPESGWQRVVQADESQGALMSVWGSSPSDVFVVGGQPDPLAGTILHFDGTQWIDESLPADTPMLHWVYGVDDRVWTVGRVGAILVRDAGVWSVEASPSDRILWGIWGASADELWAVGGDGVSDAPVLLRRDGPSATWSTVELPPLSVTTHGLFKVWGRAADDVWIVGDVGASLHWDGSSWTDHSTADNVDLISLWGTPSEGVVAVGGRASGRIVRLVDQSWTGETLQAPGLNGVWVDPSGPITAVGNMGTIVSVAPGGFEVTAEESGSAMVLHAVFGFEAGPRFAVGGSLLAPPPYTGVVLRADP